MRLQEITNTVRWVVPDDTVLKADYNEYKKKEMGKWEQRAASIGARFPIFETLEDFSKAVHGGKIITLSKTDWDTIQNLSQEPNIKALKALVATYYQPRDVDRIVQGIEEGADMPLPLVLKGSKGRWIMAGNTRLNVARILNAPQKAVELDVAS